jgi:hypothetical protein
MKMTLFGDDFNGSFLTTGIVEQQMMRQVELSKEKELCATVAYQFDIQPETFKRWTNMCINLEQCEYDERLDIASRVLRDMFLDRKGVVAD